MAPLKMTFSLDERTAAQLTRTAERLQTSKSAVVREAVAEYAARAGAMPCVRLGRYVRFDFADVEAWLESCKQPGRTIRLRSHDAAKSG